MAQMQICLAATYRKYYTRIAPNTTDDMMEVDDGITSAGPIVYPDLNKANERHIIATSNFTMRKTCRKFISNSK